MPAAANKHDLVQTFDKEYQKLLKTLDSVDEEMSTKSAENDPTTIKGVIAHRIHWMGMFLTWYYDGVEGREVHVPAKGYKWNQLKAYNQTLYEEGDKQGWDKLLKEFSASAANLRNFMESRDEHEFYTKNIHAWTNNWTLGRWFEASTASHFRSANTYIRKVIRQSGL